MSESYVFDVAGFRARFPAFSNPATWSDEALSAYFIEAEAYIANRTTCALDLPRLTLALDLMTAHVATLGAQAAAGDSGGGGPVTSATVGGVSVTRATPANMTAWGAFLALTSYGLRLAALLRARAAGGRLAGGLPEREAIRKVGGVF